jgi:hypothetical protein
MSKCAYVRMSVCDMCCLRVLCVRVSVCHMCAAITQCRVIHLPSHAVQPILVNHHSLIEKVCVHVCICVCVYLVLVN